MATLKFTHDGSHHSLVATSSKITTPSIVINNKTYIPLFKGEKGAVKVVGDNAYLLSPMKVEEYRPPMGVVSLSSSVYLTVGYQIGVSQWHGNHSHREGTSSSTYITSNTTSTFYLGWTGIKMINSNLEVSLTVDGLSKGIVSIGSATNTNCSRCNGVPWLYGYPSAPTKTQSISVSGTYSLSYLGTVVKSGTFTGSDSVNLNSTTLQYKDIALTLS